MESNAKKTDDWKVTQYASLTDPQLYCLFTQDHWPKMSESMRRDALQEIELRLAAKQGRKPCPVREKEMRVNSMGYFDGNQIVINSWLLREAKSIFGGASGGRGIEALDTVIHEGRHAFQHAAAAGRVKTDVPVETRRAWLLNILAYQGSGANAQDFSFYAFQPIERDAREYAGRQMAEIYRAVMAYTRKADPVFERGIESLRQEKRLEFFYAKSSVSEKAVQERIAKIEKDFVKKWKSTDRILLGGEVISLKECFAACGIHLDNPMELDEQIQLQMEDLRAILKDAKTIDDFLDGLDEDSLRVLPDGRVDDPGKFLLDNVVAGIMKKKYKYLSFPDSTRVTPDGRVRKL